MSPAALGFTWLATVPPTAGLVGKLFGMRYLSTLFGLTLLSHQVGGFLGAWLGGLSFVSFGDYTWMWYADIVLAIGAALINLPIREAHVGRIQPMAGQAFAPSLPVHCSRRLSDPAQYPAGTSFLLMAKLTDRKGGPPFLYCYHGDPVTVLSKPEAKKFLLAFRRGRI
jgi:hypothetical protein